MNRQQAKELLPIIQAYAEGKTIQVKLSDDFWYEYNGKLKFDLDPQDYRIKPEPKYRPFKSQKECWNEMLKHQPFGWLKGTSNEALYSILEFTNEGCVFAYGPLMPFIEVYKYYTFADDAPFGIKE